jgi:tRNA(Arg) A34 adenosine deaminase TadA
VTASTDRAWERALELAWEAFCAGTTPVGAVVIDAAGGIVAEGRGRRYEPEGPPGQRTALLARAADPRTQHLITEHATTHAPLATLRSALPPLT